MTVRLFNLRGVPDDEADEIRHLLQEDGVDFYETPPGNWGISAPAFWLRDTAQTDRAKKLIADYQDNRAATARAARVHLKQEGKDKSILDAFREEPVKFIAYVGTALVILYFSTKPFLDAGQ
ncbi:MAG: DUF6164 family protein [Gammaproteobacteria bacterium]|nr:DUF6164 family protein [Gammaproteobacteria bacterium]